ncbi:hypothetical protein ZIOFF_061851 [Zingiber officinale]|uniref:Uncharacterized protein n=1 Tax=Zingiber officinale TaxID=94328 RepID=A0A8J5KEW9_ZINOF|nr:hypothetical protein ZIOFF_061851 [Zingiber officinale]
MGPEPTGQETEFTGNPNEVDSSSSDRNPPTSTREHELRTPGVPPSIPAPDTTDVSDAVSPHCGWESRVWGDGSGRVNCLTSEQNAACNAWCSRKCSGGKYVSDAVSPHCGWESRVWGDGSGRVNCLTSEQNAACNAWLWIGSFDSHLASFYIIESNSYDLAHHLKTSFERFDNRAMEWLYRL